MGGNDSGNQQMFRGIAKHFNAYTNIGRRNCVLLTYGAILALGFVVNLKTQKKPAIAEK